MISRKTYFISMAVFGVLVAVVTQAVFKPGKADSRTFDKYQSMAEKLQEHCYYVSKLLHKSVSGIDAPPGSTHDGAAGQLDILLQSTEQLDMCLDGLSSHFDNLKCALGASNDNCRREFAKSYLDTIPERYQKFVSLE